MKTLFFILRIELLRFFNPNATHCFFYSEGQRRISDNFKDTEFDDWPKPLYKGLDYTEMKGFEFGYFSNWEDAKFLGIGTFNDVTYKQTI